MSPTSIFLNTSLPNYQKAFIHKNMGDSNRVLEDDLPNESYDWCCVSKYGTGADDLLLRIVSLFLCINYHQHIYVNKYFTAQQRNIRLIKNKFNQ